MEIKKAWIEHQRKLKEVACCGVYSPEQARSQTAILFTSFPVALDALEASIQREAEKDATIALLTAERDAAVHDLALCGSCKTCKNEGKLPAEQCENCGTFDAETGALIDFWEWRGPCAENAPTGDTQEESK